MKVLAFIVVSAVAAGLFKLSVSLFAPSSPNSFLRALVTGFLSSIGAAGSVVVLGAGVHLLAGLVVPLVIVKISYGMSFFRTLVVTVFFYGLLWFAGAALDRVSGAQRAHPVEGGAE